MTIKIHDVNKEARNALITLENGKVYTVGLTIPNNKGTEKELWVDLRGVKVLFGEGDHKNWASIPRDTKQDAEPIVFDTLKKQILPPFITILNLQEYVSADQYEIAKQIFATATKKLNEKRIALGYKPVKEI